MNKPLRNPDIVWRAEKRRQEKVIEALESGEDVDDSGTVILLLSGMMHQLNLVGGMIWQLCDGDHTIEDIADVLGKEFDVSRAEVTDDIVDFVTDLTDRGWLING